MIYSETPTTLLPLSRLPSLKRPCASSFAIVKNEQPFQKRFRNGVEPYTSRNAIPKSSTTSWSKPLQKIVKSLQKNADLPAKSADISNGPLKPLEESIKDVLPPLLNASQAKAKKYAEKVRALSKKKSGSLLSRVESLWSLKWLLDKDKDLIEEKIPTKKKNARILLGNGKKTKMKSMKYLAPLDGREELRKVFASELGGKLVDLNQKVIKMNENARTEIARLIAKID